MYSYSSFSPFREMLFSAANFSSCAFVPYKVKLDNAEEDVSELVFKNDLKASVEAALPFTAWDACTDLQAL